MQRSDRLPKTLPPLALAIILLGIYLATLARGLSWANSGADGGDLIAAVATNGVAHPTGYPTWLLLAKLFQSLPLGTLAFRTNLMSAVFAVAAAVLVYFLTVNALGVQYRHKYWPAGFAAGLGFGLSPLLWSQAVITEVYSLHAFFTALILFLFEFPPGRRNPSKWKNASLGLAYGLALGNHITIAFLLPLLFSDLFARQNVSSIDTKTRVQLSFNWRSLFARFLWMLAGLVVYLTLPLKALSHPPVNWGDASTFPGFAWLISGRLYQDQSVISSIALLVERIRSAAALILDQLGLIGLALALVGLVVFFQHSRLYFSLLWITVASTLFAIGYSTNDSFVYLIPASLCLAVWMGMAAGRLMDAAARRWRSRWVPISGGLAILGALAVQGVLHWRQVDASGDTRAQAFGQAVLNLAPQDAIIFARGDQAIFSMWYFHYALHERPDLVVIAPDLLQFEWYAETLRATYPGLDLSEPFPFPETVIVLNPHRSVCYITFSLLPEINCLPPRGLASH